MEKKFWSRKEVADFLCISIGTLSNYGCRHAVYKPDHVGTFHHEHVQVLEKVWAKILTPEEGLNLWAFKKMHARRKALQPFKSAMVDVSSDVNLCSKSKRRVRSTPA